MKKKMYIKIKYYYYFFMYSQISLHVYCKKISLEFGYYINLSILH